MSPDTHKLREQVGIALRFPFVALLGALWVTCIWWWLAAIVILAAVATIIVRPIVYLPFYIFKFLELAINNSKEEVLPGYWDRYPDLYLEWCEKSVKLGFPTLRCWLMEGFGS